MKCCENNCPSREVDYNKPSRLVGVHWKNKIFKGALMTKKESVMMFGTSRSSFCVRWLFRSDTCLEKSSPSLSLNRKTSSIFSDSFNCCQCQKSVFLRHRYCGVKSSLSPIACTLNVLQL